MNSSPVDLHYKKYFKKKRKKAGRKIAPGKLFYKSGEEHRGWNSVLFPAVTHDKHDRDD